MLKKMSLVILFCFIFGSCGEDPQPTAPAAAKADNKPVKTPVPVVAAKTPVPSPLPTPKAVPVVNPAPIAKVEPQTSTVVTSPYPTPTISPNTSVNFVKVFPVFQKRCFDCHSAFTGYGSTVLETEEEIRSKLGKIKLTVVDQKTMPPTPTKMTQAERDLIGEWIRGGAK